MRIETAQRNISNSMAYAQLQKQALETWALQPKAAEAALPVQGPSPACDTLTLSTPAQRLAASTLIAAAGNEDLGRKRCYRFVKQGLATEGVELTGKSAHLAANQLARNDRFQEIKVKAGSLSELSVGTVVVWNKNEKHPNGHISVALGDGREVSDRVRQQVESYGTSVRAFVPKDVSMARPTFARRSTL